MPTAVGMDPLLNVPRTLAMNVTEIRKRRVWWEVEENLARDPRWVSAPTRSPSPGERPSCTRPGCPPSPTVEADSCPLQGLPLRLVA